MTEKHVKTRDAWTEATSASLAQNIAHELRNPLTNVRLAFAQFVDEAGELTPQAETYKSIVNRNLSKIDALLDALLKSYGNVKLHPQPVALRAIAEAALSNVNDRARLEGVTLARQLDGITGELYADVEHLELAVTNVLLNAIEASESKKGEVNLYGKVKGRLIQLVIEDSGKGLPENVEKVFSPFYSGRQGGMGLGLTVTRSIIHAHSGELHAENRAEGGARFTLTFEAV
jgi:signal transduction histidine kinase